MMVYIDVYIHAYMYTDMHILYVYIYMCIYIYLCIFTYIYMHASGGVGKAPKALQPHVMHRRRVRKAIMGTSAAGRVLVVSHHDCLEHATRHGHQVTCVYTCIHVWVYVCKSLYVHRICLPCLWCLTVTVSHTLLAMVIGSLGTYMKRCIWTYNIHTRTYVHMLFISLSRTRYSLRSSGDVFVYMHKYVRIYL